MMQPRLWIVILLFVIVGCDSAEPTPTPPPPTAIPPTPTPEPAQPTWQPGSQTVERLEVNGETRLVHLYMPTEISPTAPLPLIINLHPFNTDAAQHELISSMAEVATPQGYIVANPNGMTRLGRRQWQLQPGADNPDILMLRALVDFLDASLELDHSRIYVTGFSNGGGMTHRVGCEMADIVAAIAPVAGVYLNDDECTPTRPIPVLAIHGTADPSVPWEGSAERQNIPDWAAAWATRNGCTDEPTRDESVPAVPRLIHDCPKAPVFLYSIVDGGHAWPNTRLMPPGPNDPDFDATNNILAFFAQRRLEK